VEAPAGASQADQSGKFGKIRGEIQRYNLANSLIFIAFHTIKKSSSVQQGDNSK
jgi:hypothetical protein